MVVDESVVQSSGVSSGERPGQHGLGELWVAQGCAMNGVGARLVGEQERRSALRGAGADHTVHVVARGKAPRRDDGLVESGDKGCEQVLQRFARRQRHGVEGASMSSCVGTLGHKCLRPARQRHLCFLNGGHCRDRNDTGRFQAPAFVNRRQAEGKGHDLGPQIMHQVQFRGPIVIAVVRLP